MLFLFHGGDIDSGTPPQTTPAGYAGWGSSLFIQLMLLLLVKVARHG